MKHFLPDIETKSAAEIKKFQETNATSIGVCQCQFPILQTNV